MWDSECNRLDATLLRSLLCIPGGRVIVIGNALRAEKLAENVSEAVCAPFFRDMRKLDECIGLELRNNFIILIKLNRVSRMKTLLIYILGGSHPVLLKSLETSVTFVSKVDFIE